MKEKMASSDSTDTKTQPHANPRAGSQAPYILTLHNGARGGIRTLTPLREPDFESGASTNSTTRADGQLYLDLSP